MNYITIPKTEYRQLKRHASAFRNLSAQIFKSALRDPIADVVEDFKKTESYTKGFLRDLESGLRKSSYAKRV
ncbi:MAG: hypothetical protein Q7K39_02750 [Candidatus Magasanikbacteria bacterium]|nr:hypothetical protein [Candidatus Magasanikbacteria bacterium]